MNIERGSNAIKGCNRLSAAFFKGAMRLWHHSSAAKMHAHYMVKCCTEYFLLPLVVDVYPKKYKKIYFKAKIDSRPTRGRLNTSFMDFRENPDKFFNYS